MSTHTEKRSEDIIRKGGIARVAPNTYQAASSKPGKSYIVTTDPEHCECTGFVFRSDCSHLAAARKMEQ